MDFVADLANTSYDNKSYTPSQDNNCRGIVFNPDGTKMYVLGEDNDNIFQYTLSTAYDVTTASYYHSLNVTPQDVNGWQIAFNNNGTSIYFVGVTNNRVYQYDLTTAYDLSTASYASKSFSFSTQEGSPRGLAFNSDGTKMYTVGTSNDTVYQYSLSTAYDVSTASYDSVSFSVSSQDTAPIGIQFNSDGTKMYILGSPTTTIFQYSLSTGFDISTASYDSVSYNYNSVSGTATFGFTFNSDFTKLFVATATSGNIYQFSLPKMLSLGTGSFASSDVGKTIEANSGVFVLTSTAGAYSETTAPTSYAQVASGSWEMYAVVYNTTDGDLELSKTSPQNPYNVSGATFVSSQNILTYESAISGIQFNNDGTKMFIIGYGGVEINEFSLSSPYDPTTLSANSTLSVSSQDSTPTDLYFKSDGLTLFVLGYNTQTVYEYTLTTAFDISTASYSSNSFSVSAQASSPSGIYFKDDGTAFYVSDLSGYCQQYTISTAWDITTASYASKNFDVNTQDNEPTGLVFNSDGTKMYIVGYTNDKVHQYSLSTAWDISTGSYDSVFLDVSSYTTLPRGLTFEQDGASLFIAGQSTNAVIKYSSATTYSVSGYHAVHTTTSTDTTYWTDINSMTADEAAGDGSIFYCVSTDDRSTWKIAHNTDGIRSIVRNNSGTWQYNNAVEIEGGSLTNGQYLSTGVIASQAISDFIWRSSGTILFLLDNTGDSVRKYTASTAYDMSTLTLSQSFSVASQEIYLTGMYISEDGLHLYVCGNQGNDVNEYTLTSAFDLTTASFTRSGVSSTNIGGIYFSADGTKLYRTSYSTAAIYYWSLSTAWNISTASFVSAPTLTNKTTGCDAIAFNADGTLLFVNDNTDDKIYSYTLSTGWDVSTLAYSEQFSFASQLSAINAITFNNDLTTMYLGEGDDFYKYSTSIESYTTNENWVNATTNTELNALQEAIGLSTSTPYDTDNITSTSNVLNTGAQGSSSSGMYVKPDGTSMYVASRTTDTVYQYTLSTAYNLSTASYASKSFYIGGQEGNCRALYFKDDGTKMYMCGNTSDTVFEYDLSTAWDISTASYNSVSKSVASELQWPNALFFKSDGTVMYVGGQIDTEIHQYALSTAWDVSTATFTQQSPTIQGSGGTQALWIKSDGTKMWTAISNVVYQYSIGTAWDITTVSYDSVSGSLSATVTSSGNIAILDSGNTLFVVDNSTDNVDEFDMSTTTALTVNQMNKTQLDAVSDANHFTLANDLDLGIIFNLSSGTTVPSSDGVSINYDANVLNKGAILGTDYDFDAPAATKVRITALSANNLKVRVV